MSIPDLKSPAVEGEAQLKSNPNQTSSLMWIMVGTIICLVLVIVILLMRPATTPEIRLPEKQKNLVQEQQKKEKNRVVGETGKQLNTNNDVSETISNKEQEQTEYNEQIEIEWLLKKTQADNEKLSIWSEENYKNSIKLAQEAQKNKKLQQYSKAEKQYQQAIQMVNEALNNKTNIKQQLIAATNKQLEENNLDGAKNSLEKAKVIDPEDQSIIDLMERINARPKIINLEQKAESLIANGQLEQAIEQYQQMLTLDKFYKQAQENISRLKKQLQEDQFKQAMGQLIAALDKKNISEAEKYFQIAQTINKTDPVLTEMEQRLVNLKKTRLVNKNIKSAQYYQNKEQWHKALKAYKTVLKTDPNSSIALLNSQRVKQYISMNNSLDKIIQNPDRLQNDAVFNNAKIVLSSIKQQLNRQNSILYPLYKTPILKEKIKKIEKILTDASAIITLKLISDNETDVVVYKVGKLGHFTTKEILLRPGVYTIVGSRDGYQDFRKKLRITANNKTVSLQVICNNKI